MAKLYHYFSLAVFVLLLAACSKKDDEPTTLDVSPLKLEFSSAANESKSFTISTNADWIITDNPDWLEVSQFSGRGNARVTLTSKTNATDSRSGVVEIRANDKYAAIAVWQNEAELSVSPNSMELLSDKGSSVSFSINTGMSTKWTIDNTPSWLSLSASSGMGSGSVTITALSTNESSNPRSAQISIKAGGKTTSVDVTQRAAYLANCKVGFKDILTLNNSVAFKYDIDRNVSYFYAGYLDVKAAGWTDEKIVNALMDEDRFDPKSSDTTGLQGYGGMDNNTEYYLCAIGFNEKGERGDLTKTKIKTMSIPNHYPFIDLTDAAYNSQKWFWTTTPNAYTSKYYMIFSSGIDAYIFWNFYYDAEIAWVIQDGISKGSLEPIARGGEWSGSRDSGDNELFLATWGLDTDNAFSPVLNSGYWVIEQNRTVKKPVPDKGKYHRGTPDAKVTEIQGSLRIFRMK